MTAPGSWDVFVPYGWLHLVAAAACVVLIAAPTLLARLLDRTAELILRRGLAIFAVTFWVAYNTWWNWHGVDLRTGLPLQMCDVNELVAPYALLTGRRWARAILYFWTVALTSQAFIQPALTAGPASLVFWAFWTAHTTIAACAVYDIVVLGFRPDWCDLRSAAAAGLLYVALIVPLDLWLGADYGFVGNPAPDLKIPPFVEALGPWPLRAGFLVVLAILGFVVVLLPWRAARPRDAGAGPAVAPQ